MRVFVAMLVSAALFTHSDLAAQHDPDLLTRRADLAAVLRPPAGGALARVMRIEEGSALHKAGLRVGDEIVALDDRRFTDAIDFDRRLAALRGGQDVRLAVSREGKSMEVAARLAAMRREQMPGGEVVYTQIVNPRGMRQRAILTRPQRAAAALPAILFVPWLSCDSIESPAGPSPGIDELLYKVAAQSGWVMLRVDKPGVGDSEGVCADTDLETEIDGSRAALAWLRSHPWVDASRIVIMGHSFSGAFLPLVAETTPVAGYIVLNSWVRTWMERLLEFERLQAEASGTNAAEVSERQSKLAEFYVLFLEQQKTPRQIIALRPELAGVWNDAPEHQYGRSARFHHQLHRINAARAWSTVSVPTLAMWSDADIVMHRVDHERLVALVNRNRPGAAELVIVPGGDHGLAARGADGRPQLPAIVPAKIQTFLDRVNAGSRGLR
jgi:alpha-beta hydrolase superfamily lysophospholipase